MQTSEDIARVQLDILTSLYRFGSTLDLPQTEIEGFVNGGRVIDDNQRIIVRVVNATSRDILSSGLIYRTINIGEAQEILKAITVKIRDLRSLLRLGDEDINLLQPAGQYPVSHLHTNLQIASLYLQGLEEQINEPVTEPAIPDSSGTISQQHPPCGQTRSEDYHIDESVLHNLVEDDPENLTRDDDDDYDYGLSSRDVDFSDYWNSD